MTDSIFQKIIDKEIPAEILFEDDKWLVFKDINPIAPIHVLIIPKKPIEKISDSKKEDTELLGYLLLKAGDIACLLYTSDAADE